MNAPPAAIADNSPNRMLALDAFRGLTVALMILVNNPGSWTAIYAPLKHAEWHGWTPTDFVFPFFLFIVGVSITLALRRKVEAGANQKQLVISIIRRAALIFALGLLLHGFPYFELSKIRIPGVLQRIALCYLLASLIFLKTRWRGQVIAVIILLLGYWVLMMLVPVPGYGAGDLSLKGSLASYIDRTLLAGHIYKPDYDPEGLFSTLPAIATTLCGCLTGRFLQSTRAPFEKVAGMFAVGAGLVMIGWFWGLAFPINKPLWTSSYVVFTAGLALQTLALCYWLIDLKNYKRWAFPFVVFGTNALAVFVLSGLVGRLLTLIKLTNASGKTATLKTYLYEALFVPFLSPLNASLAWALAYVAVWFGLMYLLYRKRIFIKV